MPSPSSGGSSTTVQKADPWSGQQPYLKYGFSQAQDLYNTGGPQYYAGNTVAPLSPVTNAAMQGQAQYAMNGGNPLVKQSQQQLENTVNGNYLNSNPYLDANFAAGTDAITKAYQNANMNDTAGFEQGGRLGSGMEAYMGNLANDTLAKNLGQLYSQTYYNNYNNERTNQLDATQLAPQFQNADYQNYAALGDVGSALDQYGQNEVNADVNRWNYNANLPETNLANYMNMIQGNYGGTSTSTGSISAPSNPFGSVLSGALTGASLGNLIPGIGTGLGALGGGAFGILSAFSDERLKENFVPMGQENGHNIYEFNYKGEDKKYIGVKAQEVEKIDPDAVFETVGGIKKVKYWKIGVRFREVG